jgi:threonylcarbamoyladenosine tRNA methylthiotransferase MtaB
MKFNIITLGCRVNAYESEIIKENLISHGFTYTDIDNSDLVIINTCSVTNMADNKSKKMVRHAKKLNKMVLVCGCSSENNQREYQSMGIDILIGNKDKSKIYELIMNNKNKQYVKFYNREDNEFEDMAISKFSDHTRAFVKIQDGCNNYCSYCIIPYVRGDILSKDFNTAIKEVETLVNNGHKEVVLTGIHTGSYHTSDNHDLGDLIHEISKFSGLKRIRISSIEVTELNDKLLEEIKNNPKVVNHFHIPLQAGSNEILKRMNRKYDLQYYKDKINKIREIKSDVSITTDVIVGHPYETDELFNETIVNCREIGFSKIHVFPYSKRNGTPSSRMDEQVDDLTKKRRSHELNEISHKLEMDFYHSHLNKELEVLIEEVKENESIGFTSNYIRVKVPRLLIKNEFYKVKAIDVVDNYIIGSLIK